MQENPVQMCIIDGCHDDSEPAHIIPQANLPHFARAWDSLIFQLCRRHHNEQHSMGITYFCEKYELVHRLEEARMVVSKLDRSK